MTATETTSTETATGDGIEISNLSTGYGGVPVVRDLNMTVNPGEVVALLVQGGAGVTGADRRVLGLRGRQLRVHDLIGLGLAEGDEPGLHRRVAHPEDRGRR